MPYVIREVENGYKVCKKGTRKCFSNDPMVKKQAEKQRIAIILSELRKKMK